MLANKKKFTQNLEKNIHIWIVDAGDYRNKIDYFKKILSFQELKKANSFYFDNLKNFYFISQGVLRVLISMYTQSFPQDIEISLKKFGKPYLANTHSFEFNLSHSNNFIAYVFSETYYVGIDIEFMKADFIEEGINKLVFNSDEYNYYNSLPDDKRIEFLYSLWTIKESLMKAEGYGLSLDPRKINILQDQPIPVVISEGKTKYFRNWYYTPLCFHQDFKGAIAANPPLQSAQFKGNYQLTNEGITLPLQHYIIKSNR